LGANRLAGPESRPNAQAGQFFRESWAKAGWETREDAPLTGLITIVDYPAADGEAAPEDTSFVCVGDGVRMQVAPPIATRADLPTEEQA
jgi:hypothetical protein